MVGCSFSGYIHCPKDMPFRYKEQGFLDRKYAVVVCGWAMKLTEYMAKKGINETEMARLLGISQPTVSRYLNGLRMPKPRNMAKIVAVTGGLVRPDDFYGLKPRRLRK